MKGLRVGNGGGGVREWGGRVGGEGRGWEGVVERERGWMEAMMEGVGRDEREGGRRGRGKTGVGGRGEELGGGGC